MLLPARWGLSSEPDGFADLAGGGNGGYSDPLCGPVLPGSMIKRAPGKLLGSILSR